MILAAHPYPRHDSWVLINQGLWSVRALTKVANYGIMMTQCAFFCYSHTFSKKVHQKWTYRQQFPLSRLLTATEMCCFSKYPYCLHSGFFYPATSLKFQFSFILSIKKFGPQDPTFVLSTYRHWDVLCTKGNSVTELVIQSTPGNLNPP